MVFEGFSICSYSTKKHQKCHPNWCKSSHFRAQDAILAQFCSLLGAILAHLGILDPQDGHLGSHFAAQNAQHNTNMSQDKPTSSQHRSKWPPRDPQDLPRSLQTSIFHKFLTTISSLFGRWLTILWRILKDPNNQINQQNHLKNIALPIHWMEWFRNLLGPAAEASAFR